ncbi:MAG: SPOR domain-containing protein [Bacteroidota bacterium]|nr:SPOR domain-containing protein [Bacteroidota bacterium]
MIKKNASLLANLETAKGKLIDAENTNQDLKDLFVSKDFKLNGLKLSNIKSAKSTYPNPKNIDDSEYIYTIQIAAYSNKINVSSFKQVQNVKCNQLKNGIFIYISGEFNSVIEAAKHQNKLKKNGYRNAFIIKIKK